MTEDATPPAVDFDAQVIGIAALGEPMRRALYRYVVAQNVPVSRDQAAASAAVPRHVAKFHLDRLVADGLLEVEYARPPGRGGPGAGRPAKLYRRSPRQLAVSLPPREYELAGRILARAVTTSERDHIPVAVTLSDSAREIGRALGQKAREHARGSTGEARDAGRPTVERAGGQDRPGSNGTGLVAATVSVLTDYGYEPAPDPTGITLTNCPFHALAQDYTDLVCGMNLEVMTGLTETLEESRLEARLEPAPGQCCVRLARSNTSAPQTTRTRRYQR